MCKHWHIDVCRLCNSTSIWSFEHLMLFFFNKFFISVNTYTLQTTWWYVVTPYLSLSHTQGVHKVLSESVRKVLKYHSIYRFWPYLSMVKNHFKILASGSGYSPKSQQFFLVTHPTCPPNLIPYKFVRNFLRCPAHRQTHKHGWKHYLRPP